MKMTAGSSSTERCMMQRAFWPGTQGVKLQVLGHAGKVHQETSDEFASIHDGYAYQKLKECVLGVVTEKAANFIKRTPRPLPRKGLRPRQRRPTRTARNTDGSPSASSAAKRSHTTHESTPSPCQKENRARPGDVPTRADPVSNLKDRMAHPQLHAHAPSPPGPQTPQHNSVEHEHALFPTSTTFPQSARRDTTRGALHQISSTILPLGSNVEIRGPTGAITYHGCGAFAIDGRPRHFSRISLVLGGSGLTPGYALIARILLSADPVRVRCVYANRSEGDILLKDELDRFVEEGRGQVSVTHVLSHASDSWEGDRGHVSAELLRRSLFEPGEESVVFLCGPKGMVEGVGVPALKEWGYKEDENMFGF
ncbi:hypothetical protein GTA08_BOTSDO06141 [Botryosphaeria dothidea]|uniref:Oxidoreductase FAD/NAD(P)-binding domain-containing protein n=1 Tax=Botryosphaeria dothidea TaxID=55169 RepID=A0A8H4ITN0_9PEZI|nr:hypothetical protein GTA08_BOTSDO06141 [Botryosphaeria dothidea]